METEYRSVFAGVFVLLIFAFTACLQPPEAGFTAVTNVLLSEEALELWVGETKPLTATVEPKQANIKRISWESDDDEVATVDSRGRVTAVAVGETLVRVITFDGDYIAECVVTVRIPIPVTGISLSPTAVTLTVGERGVHSYPLIAVIRPENATNKAVKWSSSNPDVAVVDDNGTLSSTVTAIATGVATITITTVDGDKSANCIVTVIVRPDIEMIEIPAGKFIMGSPVTESDNSDERPQHEVTLGSFYMSKYQVKQADYHTVMNMTIIEQQTLALPINMTNYGRGDKYPMYCVSWYEALVFCNKLSVIDGREPVYSIGGSKDPKSWGKAPQLPSTDAVWDAVEIDGSANGYRLPTEEEWEYACRAGTTTAYNTGATIGNRTGWYVNNSGARTSEVGKVPANAWGLSDMHGNVWEWCFDLYGYYPSAAQSALSEKKFNTRVARGGSWTASAEHLRSAARNSFLPSAQNFEIGFRVVLSSL